MRSRALIRRLRSDEGGFTLMELLISASLAAVGLMAVMSTFDGSRQLVSSAEHTEVASHRAERALEDAVARPYAEIGLQGSTAPARSTDPNHPSNRITTSGTYIFRQGTTPAAFVLGGALPHSTAWQDPANRLRGTTYYYVTQYRDPGLVTTDPTATHGKRVTVSVTVNGRRRAVTTSTIVRDGE